MHNAKGFAPWLAAILVVALLSGCAVAESPDMSTDAAAQLQVCASFYVMADFAEKIAGDHAQVSCFASGGDPHEWEPTPRDIALLEQADLLILSGGGFEHWADSVLPTLQSEQLTVLVTAQESWLVGGPTHNDGHVTEGQVHSHSTGDPHFWLDPVKARAQLEAIGAALCELDPQRAGLYSQNTALWTGELDLLHSEFEAGLAELTHREVVTSHAAFSHLCSRYGLEQIAVQNPSPEGEPDPARMAQTIRSIRSLGIPAIFFEPSASPKVAEAIARETGVNVAVLDPLEGLAADRTAGGEDYFSVMRENLANLEEALQ